MWRNKGSGPSTFEQLYSLEDIPTEQDVSGYLPPPHPQKAHDQAQNTIDLTDELPVQPVRSKVLKRRSRRKRAPQVPPGAPKRVDAVMTIVPDQVLEEAIALPTPLPVPAPDVVEENPAVQAPVQRRTRRSRNLEDRGIHDDRKETLHMGSAYWDIPKNERKDFVDGLESRVADTVADPKAKKKAIKAWKKTFGDEIYATAWKMGGFGEWAKSRLSRWSRRGFKWSMIGAIAAAGIGAVVVPATIEGLHYTAMRDKDWKYTNIPIIKDELLPTDSVAFASDGVTELGSLMSANGSDGIDHREDYLDFEDIPERFYQAMKASEDKRFDKDELCNKYGPDWCGMAFAIGMNLDDYVRKALGANIRVPGGSNLYMQTADNLFAKRGDPRYRGNAFAAKIPEILDAIRLRHHLGPEGVFEVNTNVFFVSGRKFGYPAAGKHHFNMTPEQLKEKTIANLVRNAFIAGSIKYPSHVDVVVATNGKREQRMKKAISRTSYVLGRMEANAFITPEQHTDAIRYMLEQGIPFNHGASKFQKDLIVKEVRKETDKLFAVGGVCEGERYSDANGTNVVTTIDPELQPLAHHSLQRALSMWTVQFDGYHPPTKRKGKPIITSKPSTLEDRMFYTAEVGADDIHIDGKKSHLKIHFANALVGTIDYESLRRITRFDKQHDAKTRGVQKKRVKPTDVESLLKKIKDHVTKGHEHIYVSYRARDDGSSGSSPKFDLEQQPSMEASFVLMDATSGKIRAMVGSFDNTDFNYLTAKGDFGSAGKALVHGAAALRSWDLFGEQYRVRADVAAFKVDKDNYYMPKNFGSTQFKWDTPVQMVAASRNLSNVGMLLRWWDHLSPEEFETAMHGLSLLQREDETLREYKSRGVCNQGKVGGGLKLSPISDYVKFRQGDKERIAFEIALENYLGQDATAIDIDWVKDELLFEPPSTLISTLEQQLKEAEKADDIDKATDIEYRLETFAFNFRGLSERARNARYKIEAALRGDSEASAFFYKSLAPAHGSSVIFNEEPISYLKRVNGEAISADPSMLDGKKVLLSQTYIPNKITLHTLEMIQRLMESPLEVMEREENLYQFRYLQHHPQFKVLAAEMDYREYLGKLGMDMNGYQCIYGVVLGNVSTRMIDLATAYARQYTATAVSPTIIDRYEGPDGSLICENRRTFDAIPEIQPSREYVADLQHAVAMYGTAANLNRGRYPHMSVDVDGKRIRVWAGGKTGTGNNSKFVTFVGVIPNLQAQYDALPEGVKADGLKELSLDSMLIGVVKVQEYRPHGRKDDLPMEYGCNSEGKHCSMQMFGSTAASSIFVPIARKELQRHAHLISGELPSGGMLDMVTGDGSTERYVYLGNKSKRFGVTVYANYEGSTVDTTKCAPIDNGYSPEVCEITLPDGDTQKRKIFTVKSSK